MSETFLGKEKKLFYVDMPLKNTAGKSMFRKSLKQCIFLFHEAAHLPKII